MRKSKYYNARNKLKFGAGWYGKGGRRSKVVKVLRDRQNGNCAICKMPMFGKDTVDHIKAFSEGGKTKINNLQLLCHPCHVEKDRENTTKYGIIGSQLLKR